jgi:hypothetical protein
MCRGEIVGWSVVDEIAAPEVLKHTWRLVGRGSHCGYAIREVGGKKRRKTIWLHRVVLGLDPEDPQEGDHKNHDTLDNRRSNLRAVTHAQNMQNKRANAKGTSAWRGVNYQRKINKWQARVRFEGKQRYLGVFDTEAQAGAAAAAWRKQHMPFAIEGD